ncbi:MAG: hypothetical protein OEY01_07780 [Desulfobulbaceae bacterium]|nr:hypothetical protein [Desulfobulbaceae bacterium]HIJ78955.1 hypothetical protein [Deltaproteobacteria bacterium]
MNNSDLQLLGGNNYDEDGGGVTGKRIVSIVVLIFLFCYPLVASAEQDKSFGKKVGEVAREVKEGTTEAFRQTQKVVKKTSSEVAGDSKSLWQKAKEYPGKFWDDVKEGFRKDK